VGGLNAYTNKFIYTEAPIQSENLDLTSDKEPAKQAVQPNSDIQFEAYNVKGKVINADMTTIQADSIKIKKSDSVNAVAKKKPGLIMLDGVVISHEEMEKISPSDIASLSVIKDKSAIETYGEKAKDGVILITSKDKTAPLIVIDGVRRPEKTMADINPETIESVSVLKNESGKALYGEDGKNGVVLITTKERTKTGTNKANQEVTVIGYGKMQKESSPEQLNSGFRIRSTGTGTGNKPLIIIDGVIIENQDMNNIPPDSISHISVLKGEQATNKYGEKAKNGVVVITSKKAKAEKTTGEVTVIGYGPHPPLTGNIGSTNNFQIRSSNFLANQPLYVIDGIRQKDDNLPNLNPETIASISVLKNESGKALYGEDGKNGVILITTKNAKREENSDSNPEVTVVGYGSSQASSGKISLRSVGNLANSSPLVVIDGTIQKEKTIKDIDPKTIQSINVLKNESAIQKYGDAAKNGVMEVTQKSESTAYSVTEHKLIIVPNPATDNATITLDGAVQPARLEVSVYDRFGKLMKKEQKNGPTFSLSVSDLITGTYYLLVSDNTKQYTGSLLVVR